MARGRDTRKTSPRSRERWWLRPLHLFALAGFAISQPLFDLLVRQADFLVAHDVQPSDLLALTFILGVLVPSVAALAVAVTTLALARIGRALFAALFVVLVACIALPPLDKTPVPGVFQLLAALALGAAVILGYRRFALLRAFLTLLAPASLIFSGAFLLSPPVKKLLASDPVAVTSPAAGNGTSPVVVVVFDEFPVMSLMNEKLEIDADRYPAFAALAQDATWFRNGSTVATSTTWAVPAILTGRYPDRWRQATAQDYPRSLFTALGEIYELHSFEPITRLCPRELCQNPLVRRDRGERLVAMLSDISLVFSHVLLPHDLGADLPDVTGSWKDFARPDATEPRAEAPRPEELEDNLNDSLLIFSSFLETLRPSSRPSLHFLHLNVPHVPWKYLPSGKEYGGFNAGTRPPGDHKGIWSDDEWLVIQGYQRHLLQVGFADHLLGRLVATLVDRGLYDRALLVVTADHGVSFHPGRDRRQVDELTVPDVMFVPFFLKLPHQARGTIDDRNVESVDILPSITHALGMERPPWPVDGRSVLDPAAPERPRKILKKGPKTLETPPLPVLLAGRRATVERKLKLFGWGSEPGRLYTIGPYPELVGRRPADLPVAVEAGTEVVLDQAWQFDDLDPSGRFVPANVTGRIRLGPGFEPPLTLAVAVNGVIRALTRTFEPRNGWTRFAAMVPETAFAAGTNDVEIFVTTAADRGPRLIPTRSRSGRRYDLVRSSGSEVALSASDGRSFPLLPEALQGGVRRQGTQILGWAADLARAREACRIVIFVDGRFAYETRTGAPLPEGSPFASVPELARVGFHFVPPSALLAKAEIRIFALRDGAATELVNELEIRTYLVFRGEQDEPWKILTPSGQVRVFDRDAVRGHVTRLEVVGDRLRFFGWTIDSANTDVPETVVAFAGHRWIVTAGTGAERPAVERRYPHPRYRSSGFEIEVPRTAVVGASPRAGPAATSPVTAQPPITFVAISRHGKASTLQVLKQPRSELERLRAGRETAPPQAPE